MLVQRKLNVMEFSIVITFVIKTVLEDQERSKSIRLVTCAALPRTVVGCEPGRQSASALLRGERRASPAPQSSEAAPLSRLGSESAIPRLNMSQRYLIRSSLLAAKPVDMSNG